MYSISRNRSAVDQHEKTSSNIKHEKFVPSPEISLSGIEISKPSGHNDNFYPTSQYYHPVKHSVHFHSSTPIVSKSNWMHPTDLDSLQKDYPKFNDELKQNHQNHKDHEKLTFPSPTIDNTKWYFSVDRPRIESTEKPAIRPSGKWKWVSDDEEEQEKRNIYQPISPSTFPQFPTNEFSYTFDVPSTESTPFSYATTKYEEHDQLLNGESPPTSILSGSEAEWDSPFSSNNNGKLKHSSKGKGSK